MNFPAKIYPKSCLLLLASLSLVDGINVLIMCPTPSYSHQEPFIALGKDLVRRGHKVTIVTTEVLKEPLANYTVIDISDSYQYFRPKKTATGDVENKITQRRKTSYEFIHDIEHTVHAYTEHQLASEPMQRFLKEIETKRIKFDLIIHEGLLHTAYLGFVPKLGYPPLIIMQSLNPTCLFGKQIDTMICNPSYIPEILTGYSPHMSFLQRLDNLYMHLYTSYIVRPRMIKTQDGFMAKYLGIAGISGQEIEESKALQFFSTSWMMTHPRPTFPNTILLGPLHLGQPQPLPQDLETWLEGAQEGVIFFSLGSNMRSASLREDKRRALITSFAQFPRHRVIWKWEEETPQALPHNVMCRKWLPQHDLLAHPKVKLFITQGGLQSLQEAVHNQVPIIGIPFFGDQDSNVRKLESAGVGRYLEYEDMTSQTLTELIESIVYNETVYQRVKLYSKLSTQILSPLDTAYWWIQYVLAAKGDVDHLRVNLNQIPWYQYYFVDVGLCLLFGTVAVVYVLFKTVQLALGSVVYCQLKKQKIC